MNNKKGQAEIADGLILMLIASTCSVILLSVSSDYGVQAARIYKEESALKLAQNTLLTLYHITDQQDSSPFYKKSLMVAVSHSLAQGDTSLSTPDGRPKYLITDILEKYHDELGWHFLFAVLPDGKNMDANSMIITDSSVQTPEQFASKIGNPNCASAALTYPNTNSCKKSDGSVLGGPAGSMCYVIFQICTWQT